MADTIERTIYKLEIDDSSYSQGVEKLSASTKRFSDVQTAANKALQILETALKEQSQELEKAKKNLDSYTGSDEKYRQQLTRTFKQAQTDNQNLNKLVIQSRQEYEAATKAAQNFANISQRAANLQPQPGARIAPTIAPSQPAALSAQIFNTVNLQEFGELAAITERTKVEFDELRDSITLAEERLKQLDSASEEFKQLAPVVEQAKKALNEYDQAAEGATESTTSLRTQIRLGKEELVKLEAVGKANSKEYFELEKRVAKLTDAFNDQQARIRILASDTKLLDFGKGAITAATAAFSAYTSVQLLVGEGNEELQKKTMQLFAAMQLLQSLEQLSNLTRREGVLATLAQSGAQSAYTAVVGASTGALRAFRLALAATGIGAVIVGITLLVNKIQEMAAATAEAEAAQRQLAEVSEEAIKSFTAEVTHLKLIKDRLNDLNTPQKERIKLAKEYNKTAEEGNKIDLKQIDNIALVNKAIDTQIAKIIERARARAAENVIVKKQEAVFLAEEQARARLLSEGQIIVPDEKDLDNFFVQQEIDKIVGQQAEVIKARAELEAAFRNLSPLIKTPDLISPDFGKDTKKIENVFAQKLRELQAKLAEVTAKSFESEGTIRKQFQASLEKEIGSLNELVKDKKLTKDQAAILIELTTRINEVQLNEALDQFNKKVTDAREKLNEELRSLQQQNTEESIQLLQNEFERRRQLIEFNEQQALEDSKRNTEERLKALEEQRDLIGEQSYQDAKNRIVQAGEDEQTNIIVRASQERQELAIDAIKKSLDRFRDILFNSKLIGDQAALAEIQALSETFLTGKINYEKYKKDLAAIQKKYEDQQLQNTINVLEQEIRVLNRKINNTLDLTAEQYEDLIKLVRQKEAELVAARTQQAIQDQPETENPEVQRIAEYASSIGQLTDSVIAFWQRANEAEANALDRSISLQERRVEAAQRIAERGNAQYLKAETDRLKELEIARENAARKQLGIDAALQASQILVGITGAIAKIATPGIGIAETITSIGIIVGALATGYGLVKSLQGNQPRFFKGTKDTGRGGKEDDKGGFSAILHPHEAVIPADKNKAYKPTIDAIMDGKINPNAVNNFVLTNHSIKPFQQPNYQRIKEAAEINIGHDGKVAVAISEQNKLIQENNDLQRQTIRALKSMGVNVNLDKNGLALSVMEVAEQIKIDRKI